MFAGIPTVFCKSLLVAEQSKLVATRKVLMYDRKISLAFQLESFNPRIRTFLISASFHPKITITTPESYEACYGKFKYP